MKTAYYQNKEGTGIRCGLCPHRCLLQPGQQGLCKSRKNLNGELIALNYGKIVSLALDPIEKKPLRNFYPGSKILSVGTFGCNFVCDFCQNWTISQASNGDLPTLFLQPDELVQKAVELIPEGNIGIAFTYNEPTIWYEYVLDTAIKAKAAHLKVVLVTNGYINEAPLRELLPSVDAMNIDLKAFNDRFYRTICGGTLDRIKATIQLAASETHVEITTLIVPGLNDDVTEIEAMAKWLSDIDPDISLHLSRYFPRYKRSTPDVTPVSTLESCHNAAKKHLNHVYIGNI